MCEKLHLIFRSQAPKALGSPQPLVRSCAAALLVIISRSFHFRVLIQQRMVRFSESFLHRGWCDSAIHADSGRLAEQASNDMALSGPQLVFPFRISFSLLCSHIFTPHSGNRMKMRSRPAVARLPSFGRWGFAAPATGSS